MEARRQATPLGNSCKYIFVPFVCLAAAADASARGRKYERRAHKHRYTNRHRKNCCIPRGAPLLILWLATRFLLDSSLCTVRLPGCALFECRCIKKQENQPCSCWHASPASNPASKLCKYLFKNFTLKCICGWVPSTVMLPECRKKLKMVNWSRCTSRKNCFWVAARRRAKCKQTVKMSKVLPTFWGGSWAYWMAQRLRRKTCNSF